MLMETEEKRNEIALSRYEIIAPVVKYLNSNLPRGEQSKIIRQIVNGKHPDVAPQRVGERTIERYLAMYREDGIDGLKPKIRERVKAIPQEYFEAAKQLREENPSRSIERIIMMLEESNRVPAGMLKRSTIYDYFDRNNLTRKTMRVKTGSFGRFAAAHRGEILQGDVQKTMMFPDITRGGELRQLNLVGWIDDYSRRFLGYFYWNENQPALEDSLMKWIILYGVPESALCDHGKIYTSHHFKSICARLGIQPRWCRIYRPQGKGKQEKVFQMVDRSFKSEIELLLKQGKISTLGEVNELFSVWLNEYYNKRWHSVTKQTPESRWDGCGYPLKKVTLDTLYDAFLCEDTRSVSKTGIISLLTNEYEVEPFLCGKKVNVRFDPYDLGKGVQVYYECTRYQDAVPAKLRRHSKQGYSKDVLSSVAPPPESGLNFLELLSGKKLEKKETVQFSKLKGDEGL
jgi:hypothetical protein